MCNINIDINFKEKIGKNFSINFDNIVKLILEKGEVLILRKYLSVDCGTEIDGDIFLIKEKISPKILKNKIFKELIETIKEYEEIIYEEYIDKEYTDNKIVKIELGGRYDHSIETWNFYNIPVEILRLLLIKYPNIENHTDI